MSIPVLAILCTVFNIWGFYARIPGTNINPTRTIGERFIGSLQLTSSIYVLSEVGKWVESQPDDVPLIGGDAYRRRHGIAGDGRETVFGDHGKNGDGHRVFVSLPLEAETSVAPADASSTGPPRQSSGDGRAYEHRMYTLLDNAARSRRRGLVLDDPNHITWIIVALSWVLIIAMNLNQEHARSGSSRPSPDAVFDTLPDLLKQAVTEPIKKTADTMNICLKAINDMAERYEKLPLADIRASSESLKKAHSWADDVVREQIQELMDLKKEQHSSTLERVLRDIVSLQEENRSLTERMSHVQGQLQVMQSQSKPQEDFGPRINMIERLFDERLKRLENRLDSLDGTASTSVHQLDEKLRLNCSKLEKDVEQLQKDTQKIIRDGIRVDVMQQHEEKMNTDLIDLEKKLEALRSDLDSRSLEIATKQTRQGSDSNHQESISQLQTDLDSLRDEVKQYLYPTVSTPLSKQPGIDKALREQFHEFQRRLIRLEMETQERFSRIDNVVGMEHLENFDQKYQDHISSLRSDLDKLLLNPQEQYDIDLQSLESVKRFCHKNQNDISSLRKSLSEMLSSVRERFENTSSTEQLESKLKVEFSQVYQKLDEIRGNMQFTYVQNIKQLTDSHVDEMARTRNRVDAFEKNIEERFAATSSSLDFLEHPQQGWKPVTSKLEDGLTKLHSQIEETLKSVAVTEDIQALNKKLDSEVADLYDELTELRKDLGNGIYDKATNDSVEQLRTRTIDIQDELQIFKKNIRERVKILESKVAVYGSDNDGVETSRLEEDLNNLREDMETRLADLQSKETSHETSHELEKLEENLSKLGSNLDALRQGVEERLKDVATTGSLDTVSMRIVAFKKDIEKDLAKCDNTLKALKGELTAKTADIEFAKSEIDKLKTSSPTRPAGLGAQSVQEKEFKELRVKVDSTHNEIETLKKGHTVLERRITPVIDNVSKNAVRLKFMEETIQQEQRALRAVTKDVDQILKSKKSDPSNKPPATELPKAKAEEPVKTTSDEKNEAPEKKETSRPSSSSATETPDKKGPPLTASRWATDKPVPPALTPEEAHELSRSLSGRKRGGK